MEGPPTGFGETLDRVASPERVDFRGFKECRARKERQVPRDRGETKALGGPRRRFRDRRVRVVRVGSVASKETPGEIQLQSEQRAPRVIKESGETSDRPVRRERLGQVRLDLREPREIRETRETREIPVRLNPI
jgi:hypothetical protein